MNGINYIPPFRWYDDYHKQNRWDKDCGGLCPFELITNNQALLPFQFKRPASPKPIKRWVLRKDCYDPFEGVIPKNCEKFSSITCFEISQYTWTEGELDNDEPSFVKDCDNLVFNEAHTQSFNFNQDGSICYNGGLIIGQWYTIYITVLDFVLSPGSGLTVNVMNGATLVSNIGGAAIYTARFKATDTDICIEYEDREDGDKIRIGTFQVYKDFVLDVIGKGDVLLDKSMIDIINVGGTSGEDYFIYCGGAIGTFLPEGRYYSIIQYEESGNTTNYLYYFSEVITVKTFIEGVDCPYNVLEWWNSCDMDDVMYAFVCFRNKLYINGVLTKPEWDITESGSEDGQQNFTPTFQKWEKNIDLEFSLVPEYLADSLTAIRLHDHIMVTPQIRKEQLFNGTQITIKKCTHEVKPVLNDCTNTVNLKLLVEDKIVDSTCCTNLTPTACIECSITTERDINDRSGSPADGEMLISWGDMSFDDGLYRYDAVSVYDWIGQDSEDPLYVCAPSGELFKIEGTFPGNIELWPNIDLFVEPFGGGNYLFGGTAPPNTYIQIQYSIDNGSSWTDIGPPRIVDAFLNDAHSVPKPADELGCGETLYRAWCYNMNCDYGYSYEVGHNVTTTC